MKIFLITGLLLTAFCAVAQNNISIIPKPVEMKTTGGYLTVEEPIGFIINDDLKKDPSFLFKAFLKNNFGFTKWIKGNTHATEIFIDYEKDYPLAEGYEIQVSKKGIHIRGNETGIFYAFETLQQLFPLEKNGQIKIPYCTIKDYPRFQYRGMHLDVGRHFFGPEQIKKYIDYLAFHKFNTFHWHLTEDQGWRIEIKKYPLLTSVGGFRNGTIIGHYPGTGNDSIRYGGFYTQEEVKDIVQYASDRYVTIIPEIEMPGHSSAAIAAYPQLSCFPDEPTKIKANTPWAGSRDGKQVQQTWGVFEDVYCPSDYTFTFIENVLDEVMKLFPSKYIHIGGDECPKDAWKRSAFCQQLIKEKNLKDEHGLQSYFISTIEKYINSKGRSIIGWDEILEGGLAPNATVMSWRGEAGGIAAAKQHHNVIMTPGKYCYFDHAQTKNGDSITIGGYLPFDTVYSYEPIPKDLNADEAKYVLGAQGNVWTEYIGNMSKLEYMIFPRMSALSEVLWSSKETRNLSDFTERLSVMMKRYELWGANYFKEK